MYRDIFVEFEGSEVRLRQRERRLEKLPRQRDLRPVVGGLLGDQAPWDGHFAIDELLDLRGLLRAMQVLSAELSMETEGSTRAVPIHTTTMGDAEDTTTRVFGVFTWDNLCGYSLDRLRFRKREMVLYPLFIPGFRNVQ